MWNGYGDVFEAEYALNTGRSIHLKKEKRSQHDLDMSN